MSAELVAPRGKNNQEEIAYILVVDDRPANLTTMVEILKDQGYEVITAASGSEALRILMKRDFAVILLDVNMPGMDGFEVAKLVRARERSSLTPIIFVTAFSANDASVTQAYSLGAVDYIFSPIVPEILRAKVAVFVELYKKTNLGLLLQEKEVLLKEVHHRVKNNLQVISSLINMQMRKLKDSDSRDALEECQTRVQAIALIHEKLYQFKNYDRIPFSEYARSLADNVFYTMGVSPDKISLELVLEDVSLSVDRAIPCGLILNELITNALKHAFTDGRSGKIRIGLSKLDSERVMLSVSDDGVGLPSFDLKRTDTLGMELVTTLVRQLEAELEVNQQDGTSIQLRFTAKG